LSHHLFYSFPVKPIQVFVGVSIARVASLSDGLLLDLLIFRYITEMVGRLVINDAIACNL